MTDHSARPISECLAFTNGILPAANRAALLLNKTALLDTLEAGGIATLVASFEGFPFGCHVETIEARGSGGCCALPATNIRYASPKQRCRFRRRKTGISVAISLMLDEILGDAWDTAIGAEGTFSIDVASRTLVLAGKVKADDARQFRRVY
ncbi:DUF6878 family protein [Mesorhizobium sp. STM 4661]|uniref:DUF6878 family protein n=1 Tax=Mesorhizobium sp. STM 4661 TaxID=1297570 RepID=UPI0002BF5C31|nr:DUF6878 family protein [Mesorhizobium sp. STM 4661]CCV16352.1 hypothetical protein MESS4_p20005 [Mesorhizobium sp. STM 4661]